jgi:hypothetical protein
MKILDAIGIAILAIGVVMTVLLFFGHQSASDVQGFTIEEIPSSPSAPPAYPAPRERPI